MTAMSDAPTQSFRLSMLLYDMRYRGYTIQFIVILFVVLAIGYLVSNLFANLAEQGVVLTFGFLEQPAGYDISQSLIDYNSQSSHLRASVVGALNTLLVAAMACVLATILGVFAGILRLSNNWLVAKLMAIYVEAFRNVPILIWIIIINTVVTSFGSSPRVFLTRGGSVEPESSMFLGMFAFTNRGLYIPSIGLGAGWVVVILAFIAGIVGFFAWRSYVKKKLFQEGSLLPSWPAWAILFGPVILALVLLPGALTILRPDVESNNFNIQDGVLLGRPLLALWLALSIYTGAFIAENVRAGILAISKGQTEAAAALGLRPGRIMNLVILPQALRVIIPPLISQYLNITKNSSLAIAVGYADITATLGGITLNQTGRAIECVLLLMLFYLTISLSISVLMNLYNNSVRLKER
ncbi:amino acid ABC transporter permease [Aestuariibius insulae]|uniref:amino acid ABC transporter permease n=1 Tax=Aestuariibius insulae TaxID=2058287 RepID=UPI00345E1984